MSSCIALLCAPRAPPTSLHCPCLKHTGCSACRRHKRPSSHPPMPCRRRGGPAIAQGGAVCTRLLCALWRPHEGGGGKPPARCGAPASSGCSRRTGAAQQQLPGSRRRRLQLPLLSGTRDARAPPGAAQLAGVPPFPACAAAPCLAHAFSQRAHTHLPPAHAASGRVTFPPLTAPPFPARPVQTRSARWCGRRRRTRARTWCQRPTWTAMSSAACWRTEGT